MHKRFKKSLFLGIWVISSFAFGDTQTWWDDGTGLWNESDTNWDGGLTVWTDGNTAVFSGTGTVVTVDGTNTVAGLQFQAGGYNVTGNPASNALVFAASGAPIVTAAGTTNTVSVPIIGANGFTKSGTGLLNLTSANTFTGPVTVQEGTVKLAPNTTYAMGSTASVWTIADGAMLDLNGCFSAAIITKTISISGNGVDGSGALINNGPSHLNRSISTVNLNGDAALGGSSRIDISILNANGHSFTKNGNCQLCVNTFNKGAIIINSGAYTMFNSGSLGGTTAGDTTVNGGALRLWGNATIPERITFNGGALSSEFTNMLLRLSGHVTFNGSTDLNTASKDSGVEFAGQVDGSGLLRLNAAGYTLLNTDNNQFSGSMALWNYAQLLIGTPNGTKGSLGNCLDITNNVNIYYDRKDSYTTTANFYGSGRLVTRYGGKITLANNTFSNTAFYANEGTIAFSNCTGYSSIAFHLANRTEGFPSARTNVTGILEINQGSDLTFFALSAGDGLTMTLTNAEGTVYHNALTGIVNQTGGTLRTYGGTGDSGNFPGESDGIHFGHYPVARTFYNLSGGQLIIGGDYRLAVAIDGQGTFRQSGGDVYTTTLVMNGRDDTGGYGWYYLTGGSLNIGTNGISAGKGAPYYMELGGGQGGTIRATAPFTASVKMTFAGTNAEEAVTFDTVTNTIALSNLLSGNGGFSKNGSGTLTLSYNGNTYSGPTIINEGTLQLASAHAATNTPITLLPDTLLDLGGFIHPLLSLGGLGTVSNGNITATTFSPGLDGVGTLTIDPTVDITANSKLALTISDSDTCGVLVLNRACSLNNFTFLTVTNPEKLNPKKEYVFATDTESFSGHFTNVQLPSPWFVSYDAHKLKLSTRNGTVVMLK